MRVPVFVRTLAALTIALVAATSPLAAQQEKKPERPRKEVVPPTPRPARPAIQRPVTRPTDIQRPVTRPTDIQRPVTRPTDARRPPERPQPKPRFRAPDRPTDLQRERERHTPERRLADPRTNDRGASSRPDDPATRARAVDRSNPWTIQDALARPDAPDRIELLNGRESPAERARVIAELHQLLRLQADEDAGDGKQVAPEARGPETPQLPTDGPGRAVFKVKPPEDTPPAESPPVATPPSTGPTGYGYGYGYGWFDRYDPFYTPFFDCVAGYGSAYFGFPGLDLWHPGPIGLSAARRLERNLWLYGGSPFWYDQSSYGCFGLRYEPQLTWDQYVSQLEDAGDEGDEVVDCASISVVRFDGAAARFETPLPALGAETLNELRRAIAERLERGEPVKLTVTLRPEEVEEFAVARCDGAGSQR
ncbi:MAG TPA: hypothetical protein VF158_01715 [Longimicrobiales bacterium]